MVINGLEITFTILKTGKVALYIHDFQYVTSVKNT